MNIYSETAALEAQGESAALCLIVRTSGSTPRHAGSKMLVFPDGSTKGTIGGGELESRVIKEALQAIQEGRPRLLEYNMSDPSRGDPGVCGGQLEVYVEPINPQATILVVGAGHVGKAVAHLAKWLGFRVVVSDDRAEYANVEKVPDGDEYHAGTIRQLVKEVNVHSQTYVVMTTRNVELDVEGLPDLLETPAEFIGVIGSKRRWQTTRKKLLEKGIPEEVLARIVSPIGLELNAETPEEIALSIMAEIIMLRQGGKGGRMSG